MTVALAFASPHAAPPDAVEAGAGRPGGLRLACIAVAFSALSFVQARRQEYEADQVAAAVVDVRTAGEALVRVHLQGRFLKRRYWRTVLQEADTKAEPDAQPYAMLRTAFAEQRPEHEARDTLEVALKRRTGCDDTHPSLSDRLRALGMTPSVPGPIKVTAADALLGPLAEQLAGEGVSPTSYGALWFFLERRLGRPVYNLDGGIIEWFNRGGAVVDPSGKPVDRIDAWGEPWSSFVHPR